MLEKMSQFFEARLDGYDVHMLNNIESSREFYPFTAEQLPRLDQCHILDLGCGTGLELEAYFILNPTARVTGIDLSRGMLDALQQGGNFGMQIGEEILSGRYNNLEGKELMVPGNPYPYAFYNAKSKQNKSIDIRKVKPETDMDICNSCGICAMLCPMGAINVASCADVPGICIKCGACVKRCPRNAKSFTDSTYLEHKQILETNFTVPAKENELFFV